MRRRRKIEGGERRKAKRSIRLKKLWTTPNNVSTSSFLFHLVWLHILYEQTSRPKTPPEGRVLQGLDVRSSKSPLVLLSRSKHM